jgi:DNA repair exonuclease SbcCD ATPase subunit/DNA repair exonuclease SbcCD nuclease subunit
MPLSRIFHLSDLHIRNGDNTFSRYEEYRQVFGETIVSLNSNIADLKLSFDDFIIVITGDIFHNKNVIGNYGLFIYREFIQSLSKIGRLYIISGNHDYDQSDPNKPSLVYSSTFDIPNVFVLNSSTSFVIDDVGFSFISINNTLDKYRNSGRIQDLPAFPIITEPVKYKVALFHGTFASAKLYNGKSIEETFNPYPLEWVQEFDYVLLGDIHKRQVFTYKKKTVCGYSGSLIQQNFGEDIINHGYLIWKLGACEACEATEINVYNDVGYINIVEDVSNNILIRTNGGYTELLYSYIKENIEYFPKNLEIKAFTKINFQSLSIILNSFDISFCIVSKLNDNSNMVGDASAASAASADATDIQSDETLSRLDTDYLLDYFKKLLTPDKYKILLGIIKDKETLLFDISKYPEDLHADCIKRNKDLEPIINLCNATDDTQSLKKSFVIKYLEWEGLLCYQNKCSINFKDLDAKTFMIKGSNGTGKSAIYDILQLAIWATNNKFDTYSAGFINHNKDAGYTIIDIEIEDITYRIKRCFNKKKGTFKINNKSSVLYKYNDLQKLDILKKDTACNAEVKSLFGDINTFLSTSMITQSIDNDILALNYKDTLATIDKAHNIQFIYHLYNLFKMAITKYKAFGNVIQSKKEVYEKLLFNGVNEDVEEEALAQLREELKSLSIDRDTQLKAYDSISADINNPANLVIADTDYTSLIGDILANVATDEEYSKYKEQLGHYNYLYSVNLKELKKLSKLYSQQLEDDFNKLASASLNKPCEASYLRDEEIALRDYMGIESDAASDFLIKQKDNLKISKDTLNEMISNKPNKPDKISTQYPDIASITSIILKICGDDIEVFNEFISCNTKPSSINTTNILKKLRAAANGNSNAAAAANNNGNANGNNDISIDYYKGVLDSKAALVEEIVSIKETIATYENDFNVSFSIQQQLKAVNVPSEAITYKQFKGAGSIAKELKNYDIDAINVEIAADEVIINKYTKKAAKIDKLNNDIEVLNKELKVFTTNAKYKYNPDCCVCCDRPWVSRIKEIGVAMDTLTGSRDAIEYNADDFAMVSERLAENVEQRNRYNLLKAWYHYYKFKEGHDKITKELNNIISSKNEMYEKLSGVELELKNITLYTEYFVSYAFMLYEELNNMRLNVAYKEWESGYKETKMRVEELERAIHFSEVIKPRIAKYLEQKRCYDDWVSYDRHKKIIDGYHYCRLSKIIEVCDLYKEYERCETLKPLIKEKVRLGALIKSLEGVMKKVNEDIIKYSTINAYNNENKANYSALMAVESNINNIIEVLDTILINFQSFRKELYDNLILNKLAERTNKIIKTLCHSNTKPFRLNYNVDISNDTVHINWLIHNENISSGDSGGGSGGDSGGSEADKQFISVSQASGFQRFAISMALRLSLYFNNYDVLCRQLFIDEGFINFDKNNLSVVPVFLKSLLHYFNTIVVLSHIDIIQDTVDETAEISFNKASGVSRIAYGAE